MHFTVKQMNLILMQNSKTNEPYFNAKQVCNVLEYANYHESMKQHVDKKDIFYLKDIVVNYKSLYKNVQGHSKFLNEAGLYSIVLKSNKKIAREIFDWITHEVMPSIRKFGEYKTNSKIKHELDKLNALIEEKNNEISVLKHNLKKPKIREGKLVYILRTIENTVELNPNEVIQLKFGKSKKFKPRKSVYDTGNKNRVQILKSIKVSNPDNIERCVKIKMEEFAIMKNKEFYECSYNQIVNVIASCVKFYESKNINIKPDVEKLSRKTLNNFNKDKKVMIKILTDEEFDKLFKNADENTKNESDVDTDELLSSETDSTDEEEEEEIIQMGGGNSINYKYILMKQKYLTLKYDLLTNV